MKRRAAAIEHIPGPAIVIALAAALALLDRLAPFGRAGVPSGLDRARNIFSHSRCELHEFAVRAFQREAVLIFAAFGIRPERGYADAVLAFDGLCVPGARGAISFRRQPSFDMPTVVRRVFGYAPHLHAFAQQSPRRVAVLPLAAHPRQPR